MFGRDAVQLTVSIPVYNEEANVVGIADAVLAQLDTLDLVSELIFVDNDSSDRTVDLVKALCAADPRVRLIVNSRNFGQLRSPTYGIYQGRGEAVIGMCADFQDPPEMIPILVERWRAGADIVLGVRRSEKAPPLLRLWRAVGYWLIDSISDLRIVHNATGFGLYSRRVLDQLRGLDEPEPFFRAMLLETGLPLDLVHYDRPPRRAGKSKNNFLTLLDFSLSALSSTSKRLMRWPYFVAVTMLGLAGALALACLVAWAFGGTAAPVLGWLAFFELHFGLLFFFVALISDQTRLIVERSRRTPLVIEREQVNIEPAEDRGRARG